MENVQQKNLWGKPLGDQRRKAAKVVCFRFHSEVSNPTFWDLVRSHRMGQRRVWSCVKVLQPSKWLSSFRPLQMDTSQQN